MAQDRALDVQTDLDQTADPRRWWSLAVLCTAGFMVILDSSIVIVAIPSMESDLGMSATGVQWVISAYAVTFGGMLLLGGRAADLLGRRRMFVVGIVLFTLASLGCGLAGSGDVLIVFRGLQGVSAAVMTPTALSMVVALFPSGPENAKALGFWGATGGVGGTAGALIGGPITQGLGWEWIFLINVPVGLVLLALTIVLLPADASRGERRPFDFAGAAAVTVALLLLVSAIVAVPDNGWTAPTTVLRVLAALALLGVFLLVERRSDDPLVPLELFSSRSFVAGNLVIVVIGMAVFGAIAFALTQYAQGALGYSPTRFGLIASVNAAAAIVGSFAAQHFAGRIGVRATALISLGLATAATLFLTTLPSSTAALASMIVGLAVFGLGLGAGTVIGTIAALSEVPERSWGVASGVTNASFHVGGALGVAVLATVSAARVSHGSPGDGVSAAFATAAAVTAVGLVLVAWLLRQPGARAGETEAAVKAPAH